MIAGAALPRSASGEKTEKRNMRRETMTDFFIFWGGGQKMERNPERLRKTAEIKADLP